MEDPFDAIEFLARTPNRFAVLEALSAGPRDRRDLAEDLDISRATAGRILNDLAERGWVTHSRHDIRPTTVGEVITDEFGRLLETVATMQDLSTIAPWLPDAFEIDLRQLADARVTFPTGSDSVAPVRRSMELMDRADAVRGLAAGIAPEVLRTNRDAVVDDGQSFEVVFSESVLAVIEVDPRMAEWFAEILAAGGTAYRHPDVPGLAAELDAQWIVLGVTDETGVPRATVETRADTMQAWFQTTFETYRSEADPIEATGGEPGP